MIGKRTVGRFASPAGNFERELDRTGPEFSRSHGSTAFSVYIFSALDPARSSRLGGIVLEEGYHFEWLTRGGPIRTGKKGDEEGEKANWKVLDTVLSKLAIASTSMREKRLVFILVVLDRNCNKELISATRKWLLKLLPRFNELGSLHVHYGRGNLCQAIGDCLYHDKPDCPV